MKRHLIYSLPVLLGLASPVSAQIAEPETFKSVVVQPRNDGSVIFSYSLEGCRFDYLDADMEQDGKTEVMYVSCPYSNTFEADIRGDYTSQSLEDFCNIEGAVCTRLNEAEYLEVDSGLEIMLHYSDFYSNR